MVELEALLDQNEEMNILNIAIFRVGIELTTVAFTDARFCSCVTTASSSRIQSTEIGTLKGDMVMAEFLFIEIKVLYIK